MPGGERAASTSTATSKVSRLAARMRGLRFDHHPADGIERIPHAHGRDQAGIGHRLEQGGLLLALPPPG